MPATSEKQRVAMAIAEHHPEKLYARNKEMKKMTHGQLHDFAAKKTAVDLTRMSTAELDYLEGFVQKCAELEIDPEEVLVKAAARDEKEHGLIRRVVGGVARGAPVGGAIGAGLGAGAGLVNSGLALRRLPRKVLASHKLEALKMTLQTALNVGVAGGIAGIGTGAIAGGVARAV